MRTLGFVSIGSLAAVLCAVSAAPAATVYLQDVGGNSGFTFNSVAVTQATFDDTYLLTGNQTDTYKKKNYAGEGSLQIKNTSTNQVNFGVMAVKDLFTLVPANSGGNAIVINSATLYLASSGSNQPNDYTLDVRRVTTDWLANAAGDNENRAAAYYRNATTPATTAGEGLTNGQRWGSGGDFGSSDYAATNAVIGVDFANTVYGAYKSINVTGIVQDMYSLGHNYGFAISTTYQQTNAVNIRSSEDTLLVGTHETFRPVLALNYTYVPEPGAVTLLAGSLGGLLLRRRAPGEQ